MNYGITIKDGQFQLNGKPFYGYGVNAYTMTMNLQFNPEDESYKDGFAMLKKYNLPFIRLPMLWASDEVYREYVKNPDSLFRVPDALVAEAEKQQIGIIFWIVNAAGFASMLGEKPCATGDVNSKTVPFMREMVKRAVSRYKDSPAVWGWEVWNEGNLFADCVAAERTPIYTAHFGPPVGEQNGFDSVTSEEIMVAHREVAEAIREVDSYRMISPGNGLQRECAYHLYQETQSNMNPDHTWTMDWTKDTLEQFDEINKYFSPDPVNTICMHMGCPTDDFKYELADASLDNAGLLKQYMKVARDAGKGFYYGEFGDMGLLADYTPEEVRRRTANNLRTMVDCGVQLGTLWQFNGHNDIFDDADNLGIIFQEISKINDEFKAAGKQDLTGVWE